MANSPPRDPGSPPGSPPGPRRGNAPHWQPVLEVAGLNRGRARAVALVPDRDRLRKMAADLGFSALRKLALRGRLRPLGRTDWQLDARLGATIVQPCVISLAPVATRVEERLERIWRAAPFPPTAGTGEAQEIEIPEDLREEALGRVIDLEAVLREALALAAPDWPRAPGAALGEALFAAPGTRPLRDRDARPFAGLADLRRRLKGARGGDGGNGDGGDGDGGDGP